MDSGSRARPKPGHPDFDQRKIRRSWNASLVQLVGDPIDTRFHAGFILFAAGGTGCAGSSDNLVTDLDRQRALVGNYIGEVDEPERRIVFQPGDEFARRNAEGARGIGFAETVFGSMGAGVIAANLHMISPLRPTTVDDTAYPLALQVAIAVVAIVTAISAEISLCCSS